MCVIINREATKNLLNSGKKFIYAWKVLNYFFADMSLHSPTSAYGSYTWNTGWNHPSTFNMKESLWCLKNSHKYSEAGLYVFTEEPSKKMYCWLGDSYHPRVLVRVRCYIRDLICVGHIDDKTHPCDTAVFSKVYLEKKYYEKIINGELRW